MGVTDKTRKAQEKRLREGRAWFRITYRAVRGKVKENSLDLCCKPMFEAWEEFIFLDDRNGDVLIHNPEKKQFEYLPLVYCPWCGATIKIEEAKKNV